MKSILDIPDASLLALYNLEDLVEVFCLNSGVEKPDIISLPIYDEGGAQFDSNFTSRNMSLWQRYSLEKEVKNIRKAYPESKIYFSINPTLPGIKASHLTCRNQYGGETTGTCIVNPYVQRVILDIVLEASSRFDPDGIIFDLVDLHGQHAGGEGKPVDISCFCRYCKEGMVELKFDPNLLSQRISPLNLVLRAREKGIRPLSPTPNAQITPEQLVDIAIKEEFISKDDEVVRDWAHTIINYIRVRSKVTGMAIGDICQGIKAKFPDKRVGGILNSESFDWVGGTDLQGLAGQVDEVWLDVQDLTKGNVPPNIEILAYAADRARYRIAAFFEFASDRQFLHNQLRDLPIEAVIAMVQDRLSQLEAVQNMSKTFVHSLQGMDFISGFVSIPYDRKFFQRIVQAVRDEITVISSEDAQQKPNTVSKDLIKKYISLLVQYREEGNELNRREIIGLAAQLDLID